MSNFKNVGYLYAIFSAVLFGVSTPAAKFLLGKFDPWLLAGIFYLSSGIGITFILIFQRLFIQQANKEASLKKSDWKWLAAATLSGGMIGPVLLMSALAITGAANASLLLTLEGVFTAIIAWVVFKEHTNKKLIFGVVLIIMGSFLLGLNTGHATSNIKGALLVAGACLAWAVDNNLTRNISAANPLQIVAIKSSVAGLINVVLAMLLGATIPEHFTTILISAMVGFIGYAFSLILFVLALRHIGTARTGAYFSLAPFVGACCAVLFLNESLTWQLIAAGLFMGSGVWLHITEHHEHEHEHITLTHEHKHTHDEHHQHLHESNDAPGEPHSHTHIHDPLIHTHFHYPDIHHRHGHGKK